VFGAIIALTGVRLSPYVSAALQPLAVSAAAVAIFASGLALAGHPVNLTSRTVLLGTFVCLVIQPLFFFAMIKFGGLTNAMAKATFVASVMPTGTPSVLFAQQYGRREAESATIMLLTTLAMPIVLPAAIVLSNYV